MATAGKFRLREKCGTHVEPAEDRKSDWFVAPGQTVAGLTDLAKRFPEKFDRVGDDARITASNINKSADGTQESLSGVAAQAQLSATDNTEPSKKEKETNEKELQDTLNTLNEMTVAELKSYAEVEEIDISGAKNKTEILDKIEKALKDQ